MNFFLRKYKEKFLGKNCYIEENDREDLKYYESDIFAFREFIIFNNQEFCIPTKLRKYIYCTYQDLEYDNLKKNDIGITSDFFVDTDISYKQLNLTKYKDDTKSLLKKSKLSSVEEKSLKRKRREYFDLMIVSYYRYYFGLKIANKIKLLEKSFLCEEYDNVNEVIYPYLRLAKKYRLKNKSLYLTKDVNVFLKKYYDVDIDYLFFYTPDVFKEGIKLYDYKGNFLKNIGKEQ